MVVTKEMIDQAFSERERLFDDLANAEDVLEDMKRKADDFIEGSNGKNEAIKEIMDQMPGYKELQRKFRKANWEIEKLHLLMEIKQ